MHPETNSPLSEAQYQSLLQQALLSPTSTLRLPISKSIPRSSFLAPPSLPLFPQCSSCLRHLTGTDVIYQLQCKHILCQLCVESRSVSTGRVVCSIDKSTGPASPNPHLPPLLQSLKSRIDSSPAPLPPSLLPAIKAASDQAFAGINVSLVPCGFLIYGDCPNTELCHYDHTSKAKVLARTLKDRSALVEPALVPSPPKLAEKPLPSQEEASREEAKMPCNPAGDTYTQPLSSQPVSMSSIGLVQSCVLAPQAAVPASHLLSHVQQSVHESLLALNSLRISQMTVFHALCSICGKTPILGCVFTCSECQLVLCPGCEQCSDHQHPLYKNKRPELWGKGKGVREEKPAVEGKLIGEEDIMLKKLKDMGFKDELANRKALLSCKLDLNATVQKLLFQ